MRIEKAQKGELFKQGNKLSTQTSHPFAIIGGPGTTQL